MSANILKNAMGVGIPGTDMIGLPIAIALGALIGKSEYGLEVLKDCTPEAVEEGKKLIDTQAIQISLKEGIEENCTSKYVVKLMVTKLLPSSAAGIHILSTKASTTRYC